MLFMSLSAALNIQAVDIFHAIKQYDLKSVRLWVKSSSDTTICNAEGQSILHAAVLTGKNRMVKAILKSGVEVNNLDRAQKTALDYAAEYSYENISLRLIQHKAKVTRQDNAAYIQHMFQNKSLLLFVVSLGSLLSFGFFGLGLFALGALNLSYSLLCVAEGFRYRFEAQKNWLLDKYSI